MILGPAAPLLIGLLSAAPPEAPSTQPAPAAQTQTRSIEEVIDELAETPEQRRRLREQQAQVLYLQAQQALQMGRHARALKLARLAARLAPDFEAAAVLAHRLRRHEDTDRSGSDRRAGEMALYAALVRGHRAFQAGRITVAVGWFEAVIQGANRLPRSTYADDCVDHAALALATITRRTPRQAAAASLPGLPPSPAGGAATPGEGDTAISAEPAVDAAPPPAAEPATPAGEPVRFPGWYVRLKQQLAQRVTVRFKDASLPKVVTYLRRTIGANIVLDRQNLDAMGYSLRPVSLKADGLQAETVLWLATRLANCTYVYRDEVVLVTSVEQAKRLGPARDLPPVELHFETPRPAATPNQDSARLAEIRRRVDALARPADFAGLCRRLAAGGSGS